MPIFGKSSKDKNPNISTMFAVTVDGTAQDIVTVPSPKEGNTFSLWNDGPGSVYVAFDATAEDDATPVGVRIDGGEGYSESDVVISSRVSAILVAGTGVNAKVRGVLWSG